MRRLQVLLLAVLSLGVAGCELIGDIFQAGLVVGLILVLLVVALIAWIAGKLRRRGGGPPPPP